MNTKNTIQALSLASAMLFAFSQSANTQTTNADQKPSSDEIAIRKVIRTETEAFHAGNAEVWQQTWLHDARATRTIVVNNACKTTRGWNQFGPGYVQAFKQHWDAPPIDLRSDNYLVRTSGDLAWVEYDQYVCPKGADPKQRTFTREYRVMVRQNGAWKIATQITLGLDTFGEFRKLKFKN